MLANARAPKFALITAMALAMVAPQHALGESKSVVLAPVSSVSKSDAAALSALEKLIEAGLAKVPNTTVITAKSAKQSSERAKRPELRSCDGDAKCLIGLGKLVSAQHIVYAEVGGLGGAQVIYLKLIDVAQGKELQSTTLELSDTANAEVASSAAAFRLLAPDLYLGEVEVNAKIKGAVVYIDGQQRGTTPVSAFAVSVGSHALRITHPEHRDFVRFVDVKFSERSTISADLQMLPGISQRLAREGIIGSAAGRSGSPGETPWYYRWYAITGGASLVALTSGIILYSFTGGVDHDSTKSL